MHALQPEPEAGQRCRSVVPAVLLTACLFWSVAWASNALQHVAPPRPLTAVRLSVSLPVPPPVSEPEPAPPPPKPKTPPVAKAPPRAVKPTPPEPSTAPPALNDAVAAEVSPPVAGLTADSTAVHAAGPALPLGNTLLAGTHAGQRPSVSPHGVARAVEKRSAANADHSASKRRTEAKLHKSVLPLYPREAKRAGVEGVVILLLTIDERGVVQSAKVLKGLGHGLDESALRAARQTSWQPATLGAAAVKSTRAFNVRFSLQS